MSLLDLTSAAADEVRSQLAIGTLSILPRDRSVSIPGVGMGDQAERPLVTVRAVRQPGSSFGLNAGGGEAEMITRRYDVRVSDLVDENGLRLKVAKGNYVEYRRDDWTDGRVERGMVESTGDAAGGHVLQIVVQIDRGSDER